MFVNPSGPATCRTEDEAHGDTGQHDRPLHAAIVSPLRAAKALLRRRELSYSPAPGTSSGADAHHGQYETAGIEVLETRLTHLAYASEVAEAMLRRQQAEANLAARKTMVLGAVGLVQMALAQLADSDLVELDPERKARRRWSQT